MSYEQGQDVIVESQEIMNGEAFMAPVVENGRSDSVIVDTSEREGLPEQAHVHGDEVVTLTEIFDIIRDLQSAHETLSREAKEELSRELAGTLR